MRNKFSTRMNPSSYWFKTDFQSESFRPWINSNRKLSLDYFGFIRIEPYTLSDWNSSRTNQSYSEPFQNLFPNHSKSFRINPKNVLYLGWCKLVKNQSDLFQFNPNESEPSFRSKWILARIDPKRIFNQNQCELFRPWIGSNRKLGFDWFDSLIPRIELD